ncbi:MAG: zinc-binding dehydrogenase [Candidatus Bathyarchaeota archaeon]|nr:zinc-binding dehydrogenase [Candidatus Bathyarchaeota archaeon]
MPREVVAVAPRRLVSQEYEDPLLKPDEIRIRSRLSAVKHGTTLTMYRGVSPFTEKTFDSKLGLFVKREDRTGEGWAVFPMHIGNITVGVVTEAGSGVTRFKAGDKVFGYLPVRETHTVNEDRVQLAPEELSDEEMVCLDPAVVALMAVREGNVKIGEKVAVFGLGAIGLMAVQMGKLCGSSLVLGIEPFEKRRELAGNYGADILIDPKEYDVGLEMKKATDGDGVDITIETSGSYQALHQAIRGTRYGGTIVPVSWYHGEAKGLNLGEEWHFNRQVLVSGARVESEPYRDHPRWDRKRIYDTVMKLFAQKRLSVEGMLDPVVKFDEVIEAYRMIDEEPWKTIKLAVKYK